MSVVPTLKGSSLNQELVLMNHVKQQDLLVYLKTVRFWQQFFRYHLFSLRFEIRSRYLNYIKLLRCLISDLQSRCCEEALQACVLSVFVPLELRHYQVHLIMIPVFLPLSLTRSPSFFERNDLRVQTLNYRLLKLI